MPIDANLANLGNLIKFVTTGFLQIVSGAKPDKDVQAGSRTTSAGQTGRETDQSRPNAQDHVLLSDDVQQPFEEPIYQIRTDDNITYEAFQSQAAVGKDNVSVAPPKEEKEVRDSGAENSLPFTREVPRASQTEASAVELQHLLQAWLKLDPKTITGLERFLEVEFFHFPEDYQIFVNMRLMSMLKQARRIIEEQKLFAKEGDSDLTDTPEGSKQAMIGAALMGYSYYKVLRKRKRTQDLFGLRERSVSATGESTPLTPFASLEEAKHHLKEAERELQRAMMQGPDNDHVRLLAHRVLDICAQVAEMQEYQPLQEHCR